MKNMKRLIILIVLLMSSMAWAGSTTVVVGQPVETLGPHDYTSDANIKGSWSFENGARYTDLTSNNHTLSLGSGTAAYSTDYCVKLGSSSVDMTTDWTMVSSAEYASWPGHAAFSALTIVGWIRPAEVDVSQAICSSYLYNVGHSFSLYITADNHIMFRICSGGTWASPTWATVTGTATLAINTNYFVVAIWDGSYLYLFLGTDAAAPTSDATPVSFSGTAQAGYNVSSTTYAKCVIGNEYGAANKFTGYLDTFSIFDRGLSSIAYTNIYNYGINGSL